MRTSLLIPLDGSDLAEQAIPFAARMAASTNARIILAHARNPRMNIRYGERTLTAAAERLHGDGIPVEVRIVDIGPGGVSETIAEMAREQQVKLVVMSAHGHGGMQRQHFGTVAHQILRAVESPVLLVPAAGRPPWAQDRPLRVLVRLDGAEIAEQILCSAAELAGTLLAVRVIEIAGLDVFSPDYVYTRLDFEADLADASRCLEIIESLRAEDHAVDVRLIVATPALDLARFARNEGADLIATAFEDHGEVDRTMLGRVSTTTLQRADMPILLIRPASVEQCHEQPMPLVEPETDLTAPISTLAGLTVAAGSSFPE